MILRRIAPMALCLLLIPAVATAGTGPTTRVLSLDAQGGPADSNVQFIDISATGKFVAFASAASDLVGGDTNGDTDIFRRNTITGGIQRVSIKSNEAQVEGSSDRPSISADGTVIAFESSGIFTAGDSGMTDVFVRDISTGKTTRVSKGLGGEQPDGPAYQPSTSANGRFIAFFSEATNLVPNDDNGWADVFVYDRDNKTLERVSVSSQGAEGDGDSRAPSISGNGGRVVFESNAQLSSADDGGTQDIYMHNRGTGKTTLVSLNSQGYQSNNSNDDPKISDDGRVVAFLSSATNLAVHDPAKNIDRPYIRDLTTKKTELAVSLWDDSDLNGSLYDLDISQSGRYVAFETNASNIVSGDSQGDFDIFRYDRVTGRTIRASLAHDGSQGSPDQGAFIPRISADGRYVIFTSDGTTLAPEDSNSSFDLFMRGPLSGNG